MLSDNQNRLIHLSDLTKKAKMLTIKSVLFRKRWAWCCSEKLALISAPNKFIPRNIVRSLFGKLIYKRGGRGRYMLPLVFIPFNGSTIGDWLFRPQTMFCLWPFVMPILGQLCRGRTVLCVLFFWKGNWYDRRTKSIKRERTKEIGCFCVPAASGKYPAIILQRSGYVGSRTNCRWYGTGSHQ